jgi:hypothetical protein
MIKKILLLSILVFGINTTLYPQNGTSNDSARLCLSIGAISLATGTAHFCLNSFDNLVNTNLIIIGGAFISTGMRLCFESQKAALSVGTISVFTGSCCAMLIGIIKGILSKGSDGKAAFLKSLIGLYLSGFCLAPLTFISMNQQHQQQ